MQSPVVGAWRTAQDLNTLAIQTWGLPAPEQVPDFSRLGDSFTKPYFQY